MATSQSTEGNARSSIVDVAQLAGVSKQTVSNVLNGRRGYTPETKTRVLQAMEALSYQPRQAARALKSRRTLQLGYHMRSSQLETHTGFTIMLLQSTIRAATAHGYQLLVFSDVEGDELGSFERLIAAGAVDGFLLSDLRNGDPRPKMLADRGVAFAAMGRLPPDVPQHWIDIDNRTAMGEVVDYLVAAGHRQLAFTGPDDHEYWSQEREEGFRTALARHGLRVNESFVFLGTRQEVRIWARKLLRRKRRPTAVVTSNDAFGADVINAAHSLGIDVGEELAVTGFGGGPVAQVTHPTLTTVQIPIEEVATRLVDLCLRTADGTAPEGPVMLPTRLWQGDSA